MAYDISKLPTDADLAALSNTQLNDCIQQALIQWVKATSQGDCVSNKQAIHQAYVAERAKRMKGYSK